MTRLSHIAALVAAGISCSATPIQQPSSRTLATVDPGDEYFVLSPLLKTVTTPEKFIYPWTRSGNKFNPNQTFLTSRGQLTSNYSEAARFTFDGDDFSKESTLQVVLPDGNTQEFGISGTLLHRQALQPFDLVPLNMPPADDMKKREDVEYIAWEYTKSIIFQCVSICHTEGADSSLCGDCLDAFKQSLPGNYSDAVNKEYLNATTPGRTNQTEHLDKTFLMCIESCSVDLFSNECSECWVDFGKTVTDKVSSSLYDSLGFGDRYANIKELVLGCNHICENEDKYRSGCSTCTANVLKQLSMNTIMKLAPLLLSDQLKSQHNESNVEKRYLSPRQGDCLENCSPVSSVDCHRCQMKPSSTLGTTSEIKPSGNSPRQLINNACFASCKASGATDCADRCRMGSFHPRDIAKGSGIDTPQSLPREPVSENCMTRCINSGSGLCRSKCWTPYVPTRHVGITSKEDESQVSPRQFSNNACMGGCKASGATDCGTRCQMGKFPPRDSVQVSKRDESQISPRQLSHRDCMVHCSEVGATNCDARCQLFNLMEKRDMGSEFITDGFRVEILNVNFSQPLHPISESIVDALLSGLEASEDFHHSANDSNARDAFEYPEDDADASKFKTPRDYGDKFEQKYYPDGFLVSIPILKWFNVEFYDSFPFFPFSSGLASFCVTDDGYPGSQTFVFSPVAQDHHVGNCMGVDLEIIFDAENPRSSDWELSDSEMSDSELTDLEFSD